MKQLYSKITNSERGQKYIHQSKKHKFKLIILFIVFVILLGAIISNGSKTDEAQAVLKQVEVITVAELQSDGGEIPVVGTLKANEQIDLRPQMPGQVSRVHVSVDQEVKAGQILVELAHRDLSASVAQASASLQSALAALSKMQNGARPEDVIISEQNLEQAKQQLEDMKNGGRPEEVSQAETAVDSAQKALEDAQINYQHTLDSNKLTYNNSLENALLAIQSAQLSEDQVLEQDLANVFDSNRNELIPATESVSLQNTVNTLRREVELKLEKWRESTITLNTNDELAMINALSRAETELKLFLQFLDATGDALDEATPSASYDVTSISAAKSAVNIARSTIKGHIDIVITHRQTVESLEISLQQALEGAYTQIDNATAALRNAEEQLQIVKTGATTEQIAIQEARVKQAEQQLLIAKNGARPEDIRLQQASVAQARAALSFAAANRDKAIVYAPISGTVTYSPMEIGDIASSSTIVVSIANKSGLEVETFVSENERHFIEVGNEATINEEYAGVVAEISPALDPINKKIEIKITVTDENPVLTLGETVRVNIKKVEAGQAVIKLPLSAIKLRSEGAEILKVNDNNEVEIVPVEVGDVVGNKIEVATNLEENLKIITDARGLKSGQQVTIRE